jgi:hypothetical protein
MWDIQQEIGAVFQGRNTAAQSGWGATPANLAMNTQDRIEDGYSHSTVSSNSELTLTKKGIYTVSFQVICAVATAGVATSVVQIDLGLGGGFASTYTYIGAYEQTTGAAAGTRFTLGLPTVEIPAILLPGTKLRLVLGRFVAGSFDTLGNGNFLRVTRVRTL